MQVTMILEFPASYCHPARGIVQVYFAVFFFKCMDVNRSVESRVFYQTQCVKDCLKAHKWQKL